VNVLLASKVRFRELDPSRMLHAACGEATR
jgi:hypothetical protein